MKVLLVIIILILLIVSVRFRIFAGYLVMTFLTIGLIFWQYQEYKENKSKTQIHPSEVIFRNIFFEPIRNNYEMTGRIYNNSEKYNLSGVQLKIIAKDCVNNNEANRSGLT